MIGRLAVVVAAVAVAWLLITLWERRPTRMGSAALSPGLWLFVSDGCRLCGPAHAALTLAGHDPIIRNVGQAEGVDIRSVPTALVVDRSGRVIWRRSGRAVVDDAGRVPSEPAARHRRAHR